MNPPTGVGPLDVLCVAELTSDLRELGTEVARLIGGQLDDETAAALERDAHHNSAPLLGDLERAIARSRLHGGHAAPLFTFDAAPQPGDANSSNTIIPDRRGCSHRWAPRPASDPDRGAPDDVVIDEAHGLHGGIHRGWTDEGEPSAFELPGEGL